MKVLIAGDFCPQYRVATAFEEGKYSLVLNEVRSVTNLADYSIINFECPVVEGDNEPIIKLGPNLRCTKKGVAAIKYAGFNCVTLANNHFLDFGDQGVAESLSSFNLFGIDYVGGGMNLCEASAILYKEVEGKKLAIINCCEHEFSIASLSGAGSNPLNPIRQYYDIQDARNNADYVLVIVHGGHEHFQLPSPRMVETYRFFVDAGADAVINHHQHCFSGYEVYNKKPIFYGLGNFCFDNPQRRYGIWTEGYAVMLDFSSYELSFTIYPYRQCFDDPIVKFLELDAFSEAIKDLNKIISDPQELRKSVADYYKSCEDSMNIIFEPIYNRFYFAARYKHILPSFISSERLITANDFLSCESHRDKILYWLNNNSLI